MHSDSRAVLILESPWEIDDSDSNRTSVIPFIEGIAKLAGNTEVYHANFYDKSSFLKALDCLCKRKYTNTIVYVAAHGYKKHIGNMNIDAMLREIGEKSKSYNITGVMLGSCYVGGNSAVMEGNLQETNLKWVAGYRSSCYWLSGTMIDCAIISQMLRADSQTFGSRDSIVSLLAEAIYPFDGESIIGDDYDDREVALRDSLNFVVQPSGQGYRASTVTESVFSLKDNWSK